MQTYKTNKKTEIRIAIIFVLVAYIVSALFSFPIILGIVRSESANYILVGLAMFGPFFSAIGLTLYYDGINGLLALFSRLVMWKFPLYLYLIIILLPSALMLSSIFLDVVFLKSFTGAWFIFPFTILTAIVAPLGEEIGWRGFITTRLISYVSPITLSLLLGTIWAGWHFWIFLLPGRFGMDLPFLIFILSCIADTLWYTSFFILGRGSALTGILFHSSYNISYNFINIDNGSLSTYLVMVVIEFILGIIVCLVASKKRRRHDHPLESDYNGTRK